MDVEKWYRIIESGDNGDEKHDREDSDELAEIKEADKAEEADEAEGEEDEAMYDDDFHTRLSELRSHRGAAMWALLNDYERKGKINEAQETPNDHAFGEDKSSDSE